MMLSQWCWIRAIDRYKFLKSKNEPTAQYKIILKT